MNVRHTKATIREAGERLPRAIQNTPLHFDTLLPNNQLLGVKDEGTQPTGSFKVRGMYNALASSNHQHFTLESAGNAASGAAYSANVLGKYLMVYGPEGMSASKQHQTRRVGGSAVELYIVDGQLAEAGAEAERVARENGWYHQSPYDSMNAIVGNATVAAEVLERTRQAEVRRFFVPVGGGSVVASTLLATAGTRDQVVGVQFAANQSAEKSVTNGHLTAVDDLDGLCDGTPVRQIGRAPFDIMMQHSDRLSFMSVEASDIGQMLHHEILRRQQLVPDYGDDAWEDMPETTGVLAEAGAFKYAKENRDDMLWVALRTGSNTDPTRESRALAAYQESMAGPLVRSRVWRGPQRG